MRFQLAHTHAYPGCRVTLAEEDNRDEDLVEFSDGVIVPCRHVREGDTIALTIAPYTTARGTRIGEKTWIVLQDKARDGWKIKARARDTSPG